LNLEYFIKRLINAKDYKSSISAPIIKIAISAIAIGMIMMIVSGYRNRFATKNQRKNFCFNGHIIISNMIISRVLSSYFEKQDFYPKFDVVEGGHYSGYRQ
jgi:lipoprotein-releasing system permease protein